MKKVYLPFEKSVQILNVYDYFFIVQMLKLDYGLHCSPPGEIYIVILALEKMISIFATGQESRE